MTFDRFDLENQIMQAWSSIDDVLALFHHTGDKNLTEDELQNLLLGIHSIGEMRFQKLWDTFENGIHEEKIT